MKLKMWLLPLALTLAMTGAIACGDDDDDGDDGDTTPAATRAATSPAAVSASPTSDPADATEPAGGATEPAGGATTSVRALDFSFEPTELDSSVGLAITVELENAGAFPHTLTVYEDNAFTSPVAGADTGNVSAGATGEFTATFTEAKDYFFRCEIHNQMQGTLSVE